MTLTLEEIKRARDPDDGGKWVKAPPVKAGKRGPHSKWDDVIDLCRETPGKWRHYIVHPMVAKRIRNRMLDDIDVLTTNYRPGTETKEVCDMYIIALPDTDINDYDQT